ncbi:MAG: DUF202 domain-containing protein [Planctomycetaceae bacterium]|nr:DUF202 domain-containing protein [Planctomycetaceae bacterium]
MSGGPPDPSVDLALLRTEWALERTQLAWIRTAFAMITVGFALDQGAAALFAARLVKTSEWERSGHVGGILLAASASALLGVATVRYVTRTRELHSGVKPRPLLFLPAFPLSVLVALLGVAVVVLLLIWG